MSTEGHRIFLSLGDADARSACRQAGALLARASRGSELFLIGPRATIDALFATHDCDLRGSYKSVVVPGPADHTAALAEILGGFQDRDFLFVKSGTILPEYCDLRLAWTAERFPGIATVSPTFDDDFVAPGHTENPLLESQDPEALDRLCYRHSHFTFNERNGYRSECVYVRSEAVRAALPDETAPAERVQRFEAAVKTLRYSHLVADHIFARSPEPSSAALPGEIPPALTALRHEIQAALARGASIASPVRGYTRPRVLHVMHSWGGGLERWVREYCLADCSYDNLILKSVGSWGEFGMRLALHHDNDDSPVETWPLAPAIKSTASRHLGYRAAFAKILDAYGIDAILVSSLIGHSLDIFDFGIPVTMVCHDYYPFCPALNITFNQLCESCDCGRLTCCTAQNPHHRFFRNTPPLQWMDLRSAFVQRVLEFQPTLIAPSPSVRENYARLVPEIAGSFQVISHGTRPFPSRPSQWDHWSERAGSDRLQLLILGSLAPNKGGELVKAMLSEVLQFCDLFLIGCGESGKDFESIDGITVVPEYRWDSLPELLSQMKPDLALLPSVVPETFSFTLQELFELAIPTLATDLGSFHDRIEDGVNGFLCRPEVPLLVARLRELAGDRELLARVHRRLRSAKIRHITDMLADYRDVLGVPARSRRAYFCTDSRHPSPTVALGQSEVRWQPSRLSSQSTPFRAGADPRRVELHWPEQNGESAAFEFHPTGQPGIVMLHRMELRDVQGEILWIWDGDLEAIEPHGLPLAQSPGGGVVVHFEGERTGISPVLPVPIVEKLRRGGSLAAKFEWPSTDRALMILKSLRLGPEPLSSAAHTPEPVAADVPQLQTLLELERAQAEILDLRQSLSWRVSRPLRTLGGFYLKATGLFKKPL